MKFRGTFPPRNMKKWSNEALACDYETNILYPGFTLQYHEINFPQPGTRLFSPLVSVCTVSAAEENVESVDKGGRSNCIL